MSITAAAIGSVVSAVVNYLLTSQGAQKAVEKATEKIGELSGEALVNAGKNAFAKLRSVLTTRGESAKKAITALTHLEDDPADADYQRKLISELEKLSATDGELRTMLKQLSAEVSQAGGLGSVQGNANVSGDATVYGAVTGANSGTINSPYNLGSDKNAGS